MTAPFDFESARSDASRHIAHRVLLFASPWGRKSHGITEWASFLVTIVYAANRIELRGVAPNSKA